MENQLNRIREKLKYLQEQGWRKYQDNFAVWSHQLVINPPIPLEELIDFEKTYSLSLPEGYRRFLLEIGNGGAGPYYGLIPLEKWTTAYWDENYGFRFNKLEHLLGECKARPLSDKDYGVRPEDEWLPDWSRGTITLCDQGCNYYGLLVVRGKERGRICYMAMMGEPYYMPDLDFLSWYERWLDEVLTGNQNGWFGGAGYMGNDEDPSNWQPLNFAKFKEKKEISVKNSQKIATLGQPQPSTYIQLSFNL